MTSTVKLQRIGNSIRATIPKEVADELSLRPGEEMFVDTLEETVMLRKRTAKKLSDFYGTLDRSEGKVTRWPASKQIKDIWG